MTDDEGETSRAVARELQSLALYNQGLADAIVNAVNKGHFEQLRAETTKLLESHHKLVELHARWAVAGLKDVQHELEELDKARRLAHIRLAPPRAS